ncbi:DNA polymerase beta palm [Rhizoctonia solani]|uniref:DNA polymerase beta palm n=1 Tax=Rhizoctonia solani TaxID=456999 RepID=A0A8H7ILK1_9AGAM|nr:DNA polymerase beta palm [Rhizoctonia solani]
MTLSSLFDSLDRLDETDDDEEDFSGLYPPGSRVTLHIRGEFETPINYLTHMYIDVEENAEAKRAKILVPTHASSTLQPRHGGTGAPLGETESIVPIQNCANRETYPTAQISSSTSVKVLAESDRIEEHFGIQTVESPPTSSPSNSSSNGELAFEPVPSENDQKSAESGQGNTIIRVPRLTFSMVNIHFVPAKASVAESAPIATCSNADLSQPNIPKLVSQAAYKPQTNLARPRTKKESRPIKPSNSFRDPDLVASRQDNHVAQGASGLFGRRSRLCPGNRATQLNRHELAVPKTDAEDTNKKQKPIFCDLIVYYAAEIPGKKISYSTKRRMEILSGLLAKVVGNFDSSVTHIVSDLPEKPLLEVIGLSSVDSIPPSVWVVGWTWVTKSMNSSRRLEETSYERFHKRLVLDNRLSHGPRDNRRSMSAGIDDVTETGMCLAYSSEASFREGFESQGGEHSAPASSGLSIRVSSAIYVEAPPDPLGSIVALAREMTHGDFSSERSSSPEIPEPERLPRQKNGTNSTRSNPCPRPHGNGFACMTGNITPAAPCVNQMLVDEVRSVELTRRRCHLALAYGNFQLSRLRDIYEAKKHEDPSNQFRVLNYTKVAKIAAQTTEDLAVTRIFQGIYGVGPQIAHSWYVRGLRTLADIRNRVDGIVLSPAQELGLQYYADLQRRMPRSEAAEIFQRIKAVALQLDPMLDIEIMGLLNKLLPVLHSQQLLSHDLAVPDDENDLEAKYMGLCQLHSDTLMRRIGMLGVYATMFAGPEVNVCLQTS